MGGYQNIVKIEEMRKRMEQKDYVSAMEILETIPVKKIKNVWDLNIMAEVYMENRRYDEAMQLLVKVYNKAKSRKVLFQLVQVSIERGNIQDAQNYFEKYQKMVPDGSYNYIFRYKIGKLKKEPVPVLIDALEGLKKVEYIDKWAYELVKLYYKAGMREKCIKECSDIILWFEEGSCVEKAKMLKAYCLGEIDGDTMMTELRNRATTMGRPMNNMSPQNQEMPVRNPGVMARNQGMPAGNQGMPIGNQGMPIGNQGMPTGNQGMPIGNQGMPIGNQGMPVGNQEMPDGNQEMPVGNQGISAGNREMAWNQEMPARDSERSGKRPSVNLYEQQSRYMEDEPLEDEPLEDEMVYHEENDKPIMNQDLIRNEREENELERTIYNLLDQEDIDEEDKLLKAMSKKLGFDVEDIFANFLHIKHLKKQIVKCLQYVLDRNTASIQILIIGSPKSGKSVMAKELASFFYKTGKIKSPKVAKIQAEKLNMIDLSAYKHSLRNCCLVVENASELKRNTIENIMSLIQEFRGDIAVVFEVSDKTVNNLFREYPKLMDIFRSRIHIQPYTEADIISFAKAYFKKHSYRLDSVAQAALKNEVYRMTQHRDSSRWLQDVNEITKSAITAADIRTGKTFPGLAGGQADLNNPDTLRILAEDFSS